MIKEISTPVTRELAYFFLYVAVLRHCLEAEKKDLTFLTFLTSDLFFCSKTGKLFRGKKNSETSDFSDLTSGVYGFSGVTPAEIAGVGALAGVSFF